MNDYFQKTGNLVVVTAACAQVLESKFGVKPEHLRIYVHYQVKPRRQSIVTMMGADTDRDAR